MIDLNLPTNGHEETRIDLHPCAFVFIRGSNLILREFADVLHRTP
jgi:hypothetical protein